jgi:2-oxoglutarate ferredoxin oxidoreductase subunit beta
VRDLPPRAARLEASSCTAAPVEPTDDPARAARRIMTDDGFNIGVLYAGSRPVYARPRDSSATVAQIEEEFSL